MSRRISNGLENNVYQPSFLVDEHGIFSGRSPRSRRSVGSAADLDGSASAGGHGARLYIRMRELGHARPRRRRQEAPHVLLKGAARDVARMVNAAEEIPSRPIPCNTFEFDDRSRSSSSERPASVDHRPAGHGPRRERETA